MERRFKELRIGTLPRLKPMDWRYLRLIPRANLVLVEGQEGAGKGYFLCWCLVQAASGAWGRQTPGLYLSSEEEPDVIQERLLSAGYDPDRHAPIHALQVNDGDLLATLPLDEPLLTDEIRNHAAGMVATDLLRDHCAPPVDMGIAQRSNNDETWIRPAARSWQRVAARTGATILGSHHRNKSEEGSARSKSTGSGAWRHVSRLVIVLAEAGNERALAVDKRNIGQRNTAVYSYDIEKVTEDFGRFVFGELLEGFEDISDWERKKKKGTEFEIDPASLLQGWCETAATNGFLRDEDGDMRLPTKETLQSEVHLSREKLQAAIVTLIQQGFVVEKPVRNTTGYSRYFWHMNGKNQH